MVDHNAKSRWFRIKSSDIFPDSCRVKTSEPVTAKEMRKIFFYDMGTIGSATVFVPISEQEYKDMSED